MKKRMLSIVLALVMVCSLLPLSSVAYAEDLVVEMDTAGYGKTVTSGPITVSCMFATSYGMWCDTFSGTRETITISASEGMLVKKVEAVISGVVFGPTPVFSVDAGTLVTPYTVAEGNVLTITDINAASVTLSNTCDAGGAVFNHFKVYYGTAHTHNYAEAFSFDGEYHWHECTAEGATEECRVLVPHTIKVRTNEEQTASTASCRECGAYLTLSATSSTTEHTVGDCVEIESNVPGAQALTPRIRNLDTKEIVKRNCKEEGNYQASLEVDGQYLIADFTLTDPEVTAATGDNRPIELLFVGFAAMSLLAAAAFTMDRKRG